MLVFFDVLDTTYLKPEWDPQEPDTLIRVTEKYKVPLELVVPSKRRSDMPLPPLVMLLPTGRAKPLTARLPASM